jgi:nitric oxide synthase-interacting protein
LTLQPAHIPVVTPDGYLFDKEAILQYIITKKNEYNRKMKEFERQKESDEKELADIAAAENKKKLEKFVKVEKNISSGSCKCRWKLANDFDTNSHSIAASAGPSTSLSNMIGNKAKQLPAFWVPSQTPDSGKAKVTKPDKNIYCPISGKVLRLKDLVNVKFMPANDDPNEKKSLIAKEIRYVCAVTKDVLTNSQQLAVLKTTCDVVTMDCVEKIIKKDWIHPLTSEKISEKDIIQLQRGGTGFASANTLEASSSRPAQQC